MKKRFCLLAIIISSSLGSIHYSYSTEEEQITQTKESLLQSLPTEIFTEIAAFLPNTKAVTVNGYFADLNSLRLTSKQSNEIVNKQITNFIKKHNIKVKPKQSEYKAFKNYISSEIKKQIAAKATQEEKEIEALKGRFTRDPNRIALFNLKENWLWQHKDDVIDFVRTYFRKNDKQLVNDNQIIFVFNTAIKDNKLLAIKTLLPIIDVNAQSIYTSPINYTMERISKLQDELKQKPNDSALIKDLNIKKEILQLLQQKAKQR